MGRQAKRTQKQIADEIGVSQSTVSRELRRGSKGLGGYNWLTAQRIGIQAYYTVDGVKNASEIVYWDLPSTGIETVEASKPTDNVWYNIAGQRFIDKPSIPGIYINNGKKIIVK